VVEPPFQEKWKIESRACARKSNPQNHHQPKLLVVFSLRQSMRNAHMGLHLQSADTYGLP
jgi:hypothetical protein